MYTYPCYVYWVVLLSGERESAVTGSSNIREWEREWEREREKERERECCLCKWKCEREWVLGRLEYI